MAGAAFGRPKITPNSIVEMRSAAVDFASLVFLGEKFIFVTIEIAFFLW
jgi:hypothetical protein